MVTRHLKLFGAFDRVTRLLVANSSCLLDYLDIICCLPQNCLLYKISMDTRMSSFVVNIIECLNDVLSSISRWPLF